MNPGRTILIQHTKQNIDKYDFFIIQKLYKGIRARMDLLSALFVQPWLKIKLLRIKLTRTLHIWCKSLIQDSSHYMKIGFMLHWIKQKNIHTTRNPPNLHTKFRGNESFFGGGKMEHDCRLSHS